MKKTIEEGHYTIKRVEALPAKGNLNFLYVTKKDSVDKFYRYTNRGYYEEIVVGGGVDESMVDLINTYIDLPIETETSIQDVTFFGASDIITTLEPLPIPAKIKVTGSNNKVGYVDVIATSATENQYQVDSFYYKDDKGVELTYDPDLDYEIPYPAVLITQEYPVNQEDFNKAIIEFVKNSGGNGGGGSSTLDLQTVDITLTDSELLSNGTDAVYELIPAVAGSIPFVHRYVMVSDITDPVDQNYTQLDVKFLSVNGQNATNGQGAAGNANSNSILSVNLDSVSKFVKVSDNAAWTNWNGSNIDDSPVGASVVLVGNQGIGMSGILGTVRLILEYSYVPV